MTTKIRKFKGGPLGVKPPGFWYYGANETIIIVCPKCKQEEILDQKEVTIDKEGNVWPWFVCLKCEFHDQIQLGGW